MKILNINSYYYSSTVHRHLQQSLLKQQLDSFTYVPVSRGYMAREECIYDDDKNVNKVECYNEIDRYMFHIKHRKILKNINKEIKLVNYNCIHAHSLFSNGYIAMKIKEKYGIPYIVSVRDTDINTFFKRMPHLRRMGRKILREARAIIFLSKPYKNFLINKYVKDSDKNGILLKSFVIPNGIDEFWLNNINTPKILDNNKKMKLLLVGAVSRRKNILTAIKSVEMLRQKGCNIILTVVGKVVDNKVYEEIKKKSFVNYVSPKPKEGLLRIYRENDIFILPSITETFGLVYPEAMSQGLPVIYTKGQGFDGQFEEGEVGYGVDCFNEKDIADKILKVRCYYNDLSKNSIINVVKFSWDRIVKNYTDIYLNVLRNENIEVVT